MPSVGRTLASVARVSSVDPHSAHNDRRQVGDGRGRLWAVLPRKRTLATQILLGQLIVLLVTVAVGFGFSTRSPPLRLDRQYEQRALAIAEATAAMPTLRQSLASGGPARVIPGLADQVRTR